MQIKIWIKNVIEDINITLYPLLNKVDKDTFIPIAAIANNNKYLLKSFIYGIKLIGIKPKFEIKETTINPIIKDGIEKDFPIPSFLECDIKKSDKQTSIGPKVKIRTILIIVASLPTSSPII